MKTVLISGASTGIGEACATFLGQRGFRVFAGVRTDDDAARLTHQAIDGLTPVHLDVTDRESIALAAETVRAAVGADGLDGLVNNAGISVTGPLEFVSIDELRGQLEVNVVGHVAVTQQLLPLLRLARGRIVNMSSVSGRSAPAFLGPYAMSKFALEAFNDALRRELAPWGIEVSCVQPGPIDTPIWRKSLDAGAAAEAAAPLRARELYGRRMAAMQAYAERAGREAIPPEPVARLVHHALTARRPRTRYLVGRHTTLGAAVTWLLPDRVLDLVFRRALRV